MNFVAFKEAVARQFAAMQAAGPLYRTTAPKDGLWETYIQSFPEGTNPIFRERTEHDCSCCKQFIRAVGNVVAIIDGRVVSIWDTQMADEPGYQIVTDQMAEYVRSFPIDNVFTHDERTAGTDRNFEFILDQIREWHHFFINIPQQYVRKTPGPYLGEMRSTFDVFKRSLYTITNESLDTVLELIDQNSLYRGQDHKFAVQTFKILKAAYDADGGHDNWIWLKVPADIPQSVTRIRNTSIGTLLTELSEGMELEDAVKRFEAMVAPTNYKRPTALVTKAMIDNAKQKVEELGLTSALERRYARLTDININNVLFADRTTRKAMGENIFDDLSAGTKDNIPSLDKIEEVAIDKFLHDIVPKATSIEVMMDGSHTGNLMSLIAPVDPTAKRLFKWDNGFSWSYSGDVADSIKERVKAAGGNVTGELCCRLAWDYTDDLDFHMLETGGYHIYYMNRRAKSPNGGMLDVDANGADGIKDNPCENIFYEKLSSMKPGTYELYVRNFHRRSSGRDFKVEIDLRGQIQHLVYEGVIQDSSNIPVASISVSKENGITITPRLPSTSRAKDVWGIKTHTFQKVNAIMLSPNYWDGRGTGNKHYFFMIDGCKNDGSARGFYNEFLHSELDPHRKVMEMVGSKMRTEESDHQLSGLGFSNTQRNTLVCRVKGSFSRLIKIKF